MHHPYSALFYNCIQQKCCKEHMCVTCLSSPTQQCVTDTDGDVISMRRTAYTGNTKFSSYVLCKIYAKNFCVSFSWLARWWIMATGYHQLSYPLQHLNFCFPLHSIKSNFTHWFNGSTNSSFAFIITSIFCFKAFRLQMYSTTLPFSSWYAKNTPTTRDFNIHWTC